MDLITSVTCQSQQLTTHQQNPFRHHLQPFMRQLINSCQISHLRSRVKPLVRLPSSSTRTSNWSQVETWFRWTTSTTTAATTLTYPMRTLTWNILTVLWKRATRRRTSWPHLAFLEIISRWLAIFSMSLWAQIIRLRLVKFAKTIAELKGIKTCSEKEDEKIFFPRNWKLAKAFLNRT